MQKPQPDNKLCPSSTCRKGALLLGVVSNSSKVVLLDEAIPINDEFLESVTSAGEPEKRFRFAGKCVKNGCAQWSGSGCGIMDNLSEANHSLYVDGNHLPECSIRPNCRWFGQEGARACAICSHIITHGERPAG